MDTRFCDAIRKRHILQVVYRGTTRMVEPHGHGVTRSGIEVVLVWQRSGASLSGRGEGWRTLRVSDVEDVRPMDTTFLRIRSDSDPNARELGTVHCFADS